MILLGLAINILIEASEIKMEEHGVTKIAFQIPIWATFILLCLLIPFLEEAIFRLPLRYSNNYILRVIIILLNKFGIDKKEQSIIIWNKYYKYIFYFFSIAFAYVHMMNFPFSKTVLLLSPFLVLPQFIGGVFMGYLRIKFGFLWGFLLHFLSNTAFLMVPLLFFSYNTEKMNISNANYEISIFENNSLNTNSTINYNPKNPSFSNVHFRDVLSTIENVDKKLIVIPEELSDIKLNIELKLKDSTVSDKKSILEALKKVYNLEINKETRAINSYIISIMDSTLINKSKNISEDNNVESLYVNKKLTIKNAKISQLTSQINNQYDCFVEYYGNNKDKFDFTLAIWDFNELKASLPLDYGISLKDTILKKEHIIINVK